ncbi:MAG: hypothetical protein JWP95_1402 [Actinotalea sp.]|nr:hypothetical protein [Actinotalea sp.]
MAQGDRRLSLIVQPLGVALVALLLGAGVGLLVRFVVGLASSDQATFADLGAVVLGMFTGAIMAVTVWVTGIVWLTRRLFAPGRRALIGAGALAAPLVLALVHAVLVSALRAADVATDGLAYLVLLLPLTAGTAFVLADRRWPGARPVPVAGTEPSTPRVPAEPSGPSGTPTVASGSSARQEAPGPTVGAVPPSSAARPSEPTVVPRPAEPTGVPRPAEPTGVPRRPIDSDDGAPLDEPVAVEHPAPVPTTTAVSPLTPDTGDRR